MEILLRRYLSLVDLAVIALSAIFAARATATAIEASFVGEVPSAQRAVTPLGQAMDRPAGSKQVEDILKRNIFCPICSPILGGGSEAENVWPPQLQRTTLPLKLLAIMYAPTARKWSLAVIRDDRDKSTGPYGVGSTIREATVDEIDETRIFFDFGGGRREYLALLDEPAGASTATRPPPPASRPHDPLAEAMDKGIKKVGENRYEVLRSAVDALVGSAGALANAIRIVPETRDGKSIGFRLLSVKSDGPFGKLGLQSGDIISAINGMEMNSPANALEVYTKLGTANHLSVGLERNGHKITEDYNIR